MLGSVALFPSALLWISPLQLYHARTKVPEDILGVYALQPEVIALDLLFRIFFSGPLRGLCSIGLHHYVLLLSLSDNFTHLLFHVSYRSCPSSSELECGQGK